MIYNYINVLNIRIYDGGISKFISNMNFSTKYNYLVSASGAHGIVIAQKDKSFKKILNSFYVNLPDGMPTVWIGRMKGAKNIERCYGPDFFREVIIATKNEKINHFFCGGKEGVADELKKVCEEKYGNYNVVGTFSPPFRDMTDEELKDLAYYINKLNTNIIWVGLSTPKQEIFAYRLSKYTAVNYICTVGAAFDFHTGKVTQAPKWIQRIGMEWFFRLLMEPKRLWKRYSVVVPLFIAYNLIDLLKSIMVNKNFIREN